MFAIKQESSERPINIINWVF